MAPVQQSAVRLNRLQTTGWCLSAEQVRGDHPHEVFSLWPLMRTGNSLSSTVAALLDLSAVALML
jgi:hypothetical protein